MLVQCPNCKSLFDLPHANFTASKFRCSTCQHVWENQHKILADRQHKPTHTFNWILLWSGVGVIAVSFYIGYPRLDGFLEDFKTKVYRNTGIPFVVRESEEKEIISSPDLPYKREVSTVLKVSNMEEGEESKEVLSGFSNLHFSPSN
jgi:predicted Zn finger-like uncharacterized protein